LRNVAEVGGVICAKVRNIFGSAHRPLNPRALTGGEVKRQSHDFEGKEEVGEDNGGIDFEDLGSFNGDPGRDLRPLTDVDQGVILADGAVFRHVASRLAHEPDWGAFGGLGLGGTNKERVWGGHESSNLASSTRTVSESNRVSRFALAELADRSRSESSQLTKANPARRYRIMGVSPVQEPTVMKHAAERLRSSILFFLLIAVLVLSGCGNKEQVQGAGGSGGRPPAPVVVASVEQRDIPVQLQAIGNVEAYQTVQIRSQVNGQIQKIFFKEGEDVREGQPLFQLDKRPFQADLEKAIGQMKHDQAQAENSRIQAERYSGLEKHGIVSHEQAEQLRAQAKADASAVEADKAAVEAARVQLQYTDIIAPISARAGNLMINLGNLVKANDTPYLVQLNQVTPIYVTFSVPEANLDRVRHRFSSGQLKVLAFPKGQADAPAEGRLTFIDNGVDTTTGMFKLKGTFQNRDRRLWPGEFVDVALVLSTQKNAVVVPTKAIQTGQQGEYAYVVRSDSTAESRPVKTAGTYQNLTLIADGLKPGERVIVNGQLRVAPNAKVMVQGDLPLPGPQTSTAAPAGPAGGGL
jgi:multidrug efflux system membrane fusion protein